MDLAWKYIDDQFVQVTRDSVKRSIILSTFHNNALFTLSTKYPLLLTLYNRYHPLHLALIQSNNQRTSSGSLQQGDRLTVMQDYAAAKLLLTEEWMPVILGLHKKTSPRYLAIFPDGLKDFNRGGIDDKIEAFDVLSKNIGDEPALASIKALVDSTYASLLVVRNTQSSAKTTSSDDSTTLEDARLAAMSMQYRNMAFIVDNFYETREAMCALIFDLVTLRENPQTIFTGKVLAGESSNILAHTFLAADEVAVKIVGSGTFKLRLSSSASGTDSAAVLVTANIKQKITISAFDITNYALHRYLNVENLSGNAGSYRVQLL